jgi:hypothetical protein
MEKNVLIYIPRIALLTAPDTASRCDGSNRLESGDDFGSE